MMNFQPNDEFVDEFIGDVFITPLNRCISLLVIALRSDLGSLMNFYEVVDVCLHEFLD